ncbi:MAG: hypothetical protein AAGK67_14925 [Pseudomonadota bacterium]
MTNETFSSIATADRLNTVCSKLALVSCAIESDALGDCRHAKSGAIETLSEAINALEALSTEIHPAA